MNETKILLFDFETSSLNADSGILLCMGYKWLGDKKSLRCPTVRDFPYEKDPYMGDKLLVKEIHGILSEADIIVSYNGIRFDVPFFNTRALIMGLPPLPPIPHVDVIYIVRHKLRLHRNSLAAVQTALDLTSHKTPIEFKHWLRAVNADDALGQQSMDYIVKHCKSDVLVLEEAYKKLRPLLLRHPKVAGEDACSRCGSRHLQSRGFLLPKAPQKNRKRRFQCQNCGGWESRSMTKAELKIYGG